MDELFKKLLESELLSEDTKTQLQEAINIQMQDLIKEAKEAAATEVKLELAEQWIETRDALIEGMDAMLKERYEAEMAILHADIASFRDLEVEMAEKLTEAKLALAETAQADMKTLVANLDTFLEMRLEAEMSELKADLEEAKKNDFGRRMFESMAAEFQAKFVSEDDTHAQLAEAQSRLEVVTSKLNEATASKARMERTLKLESLLEPLAGHSRSLMETILANVDTKELDKAYGKFIGRVMKESTAAPADKTLNESVDGDKTPSTPVVKTGDVISESQNKESVNTLLTEDEKRKLQRLAGIN